MSTTPLIKPLNVQGGTFYTFTSSGEDLGLTFNNDNKKFRFSKYVLLNLPNIETPAFADNTFQFQTIDSTFLDVANGDNILVTGDHDIDFAQSFQNYCLNFEALTTSQDTYDASLFLNVSERIFWKWLKELGVIRFRNANSAESVATTPRFTEEDQILTGSDRYNRVIQHIGEIDVVNSVQNKVNAYTEIYIHVPNEAGNTPLVLLKSVEDTNYYPAQIFRNSPTDALNIEYLVGRNFDDVHPAGLSLLAIYDQDVIGEPTGATVNGVNGNWYDPLSGPNAYFTDLTFGDPTTDVIVKTQNLSTVTYKRSRLDGIMLDFEHTNYKPIVDNSLIESISEFNATAAAKAFEFNCVLVYYDIYNPQVPTDVETNLYGVLFLDDIEPISLGAGRIPRFKKFIPDPVTKLNGNSYGFKINLKFDTSVDNTGVEKAINDFSSYSLEIFTDTTNQLVEATRIINDKATEMAALQEQVDTLENLLLTSEEQVQIEERLTTIETALIANQAIYDSNSALLDLINKNADSINSIISGDLTEALTFDLDVFKSGPGITLDKSVLNRISIINSNQSYNIGISPVQADLSVATISSPYIITLKEFGNYFRHENPISPIPVLAEDLYIRIDDTTIKWQKGQTIRLAFKDKIDVGTFNVYVVTDSTNKFGFGGAYQKIIAIFSSDEFTPADNRPIFDITCLDSNLSNANAFIFDQLR
jgi:hypothetical protein